MKTFEVGNHKQIVNHKGISCSCMWSTIHPYNYKKGEKVCRHIKEVVQLIKDEKHNINSPNVSRVTG